MSMPQFAIRMMSLLRRFRLDTGGNIAVMFIIALIPILTAIGCAIDYSLATRMRTRMISAADAASVASISEKSAGFVQAAAMTSDGSVGNGVTDAKNIFNGNLNTTAGYSNLVLTATVTKTGSVLTSVVTFSAKVPTIFMNVVGFPTMTIGGTSKSSASLPMYLDFYLTLDVSGSMGLPSTSSEAVRMQSINPDNYIQYPTGCTLACHFAPQKSACIDPAPNTPSGYTATQQYSTNNYCMGYVYSRLSQTALSHLINQASTTSVPKTNPGLPNAMLPNLNTALSGPNSLLTGNSSSLSYSLTPVSSCPTAGTDSCIQLRLDAVGVAVNQLFVTAQDPTYQVVPQQFRIGLYPFIQSLNANYSTLTSTINGSSTNPGTINYAAANLASLLDTNMDSDLGSGGTHIDSALHSMNSVITSVGTGTSSTNTLPYVFLITDGAQDPQTKGVPNGGWAGSNHATVLTDPSNSYSTACTTLKNRGIMISVLYIPYQKINPVNASFAGDEDDYANNNIPNIPASLQSCASSADSAGSYFYTANTPADITAALKSMFNHAVTVAHITN